MEKYLWEKAQLLPLQQASRGSEDVLKATHAWSETRSCLCEASGLKKCNTSGEKLFDNMSGKELRSAELTFTVSTWLIELH